MQMHIFFAFHMFLLTRLYQNVHLKELRCSSLSPLDVVVLRVLGWSSSCQIFKIFKAEQFSGEASFLFFNSASEKRSCRQRRDGRPWSSIIIVIIALFFSTPTRRNTLDSAALFQKSRIFKRREATRWACPQCSE